LDQIAEAYVAALGELQDVPRDRTADVGSYSYRYADLGAVLGEARPVLAKHSLALFQVPYVDDHDVVVETTVMHTSGQWIRFKELRLPAGQTAQSTGSAITYGRRYSAQGALGLATEDNDGQTAATRGLPSTLSEENVNRFLTAATDAGVVVSEVVSAATQGRTEDPTQVFVSEVQALREALRAASQVSGAGGEQYSPPVPEQPTLEDEG